MNRWRGKCEEECGQEKDREWTWLTEGYLTTPTREAWALEKLARCCVYVAESPANLKAAGTRHAALRDAACWMAPYVRDGLIGLDEAIGRLMQAARLCGMNETRDAENLRTIRWSFVNSYDLKKETWFPDTCMLPQGDRL